MFEAILVGTFIALIVIINKKKEMSKVTAKNTAVPII